MSTKLALLVSADPFELKDGPLVYVPKGRWVIRSDGDAQFTVGTINPATAVIDLLVNVKEFDGPCSCKVFIDEPGKLRRLTVFLEKIE